MSKPILYIIAGANGSGKTTFAKKFTQGHGLAFINADEIAKSISPNNIEKAKVKAGRLFFKELGIRLKQKQSFAIESTLSGNYMMKVMEQARTLGFKIHIIYLYLSDPTININRVKARVLKGGHNVPESDIIRRFHRSIKLFWKTYRKFSDWCVVIYNSDESFEQVLRGNTRYIVDDKYLFEKFAKGIEDEGIRIDRHEIVESELDLFGNFIEENNL